MAAPQLPAEVSKLREQLLVDQAPSARSRTNYFDPTVLVRRHGRPYSSLRIPISTLMEMRTDAILRFAQLVALVSIFTAKWRIECSNPQKAAFIDKALRRIIGRLIVQYFESWNFGWQAMVKQFGLMNPGWTYINEAGKSVPVWDGGPEVPALIWEPCVPLRPQSVAPVWTEGGDFNGIAIAKAGAMGAYGVPTVPLAGGDIIDIPIDIHAFFSNDDEHQQKVDLKHSLWVTNERDGQFGSVWGYPRLGYAFKYWWAYEMTFGILNRSVEKKGDPTIVVSYPVGDSMVGGVKKDNQEIAFQIGQQARSGSVLAVPSEVWGEDMGTANQASKWGVDTLDFDTNFEQLKSVLQYYDVMKIRSMMVSELAIAEGSGGTSSRNVAAETGQRSAETQIFAMTELDEVINRYMIPQLADANFPEFRDEPAVKVTQAFGEDEAQLAADLLRSFANSDAEKLPIHKKRLLERFQIDSLEGPDLERWEQRMVAEAENSKPEPTEAKPGKAGVTDTGFYYAAPEHIQLEGDETMLASLPKTKHYSDRAILAQTRLVRKLMRDQLAEQYENFATHLGEIDLDLSLADEREKAQLAAERIVKAWRFTGRSYAGAIKGAALALSKILARAGVLELSASRLRAKFDPDHKQVVEWANANAGAMVLSVENTTRKQLTTFLANELQLGRDVEVISKNLRKHFSDFPDWRADLIAREETKRFYNAGTLFAAEAADVKQVQALDARGPGPTDADCVKRNGRLFSVADAWKESDSEHVRGTLGWRLIPVETQLSFTRLPSSEMDGVAARIDPAERAIYLVEDLDPETEGQYLERAVDWLIAST